MKTQVFFLLGLNHKTSIYEIYTFKFFLLNSLALHFKIHYGKRWGHLFWLKSIVPIKLTHYNKLSLKYKCPNINTIYIYTKYY